MTLVSVHFLLLDEREIKYLILNQISSYRNTALNKVKSHLFLKSSQYLIKDYFTI